MNPISQVKLTCMVCCDSSSACVVPQLMRTVLSTNHMWISGCLHATCGVSSRCASSGMFSCSAGTSMDSSCDWSCVYAVSLRLWISCHTEHNQISLSAGEFYCVAEIHQMSWSPVNSCHMGTVEGHPVGELLCACLLQFFGGTLYHKHHTCAAVFHAYPAYG